jgi:hypothetical protein
MKFTPTEKFLSVAKSSFKVIAKKIYFRNTTDLTVALNTGTWTDATRFVDTIPDSASQIEYDLGNFSIDSISIIAKNIVWMTANVLNATAAQFIECKVELTIGFSEGDMASDIVYHFSGYIDKDSILPHESSDTVSFTIDSADALMQKIEGTAITTQYYSSVKAGIVLLNIPGIYVTNCNIASYMLSAGVHTIAYDFNNGNPQAHLNNGEWVKLTGTGTYTLGDGETSATDRQRITIKFDRAESATDDETHEEQIIIPAANTILPRTWITGISMAEVAKKIYATVGIIAPINSSLLCNTHDGRRELSFIGYASDGQDVANIGTSYAMAYKSATEIFVSSGRRVSSFNSETGVTTYLFSVVAGATITKMIYNARNDHLWILYHISTEDFDGAMVRYDVGTATLQTPLSTIGAHHYTLELFDIAYSSTYEYCLLFIDYAGPYVIRVDGLTMAQTILFTSAGLGYSGGSGIRNKFAYQTDGIRYRLTTFQTNPKIHEIYFSIALASWTFTGIINANAPWSPYIAGYIPATSTIIGFDEVNFRVISYTDTSSVATTLLQLNPTGWQDVVEGMFSDGQYVCFTTRQRRFWHFADAAGLYTSDINLHCAYQASTIGNGRTYAMDVVGRIVQFHTVIERFLDRCIFEEKAKGALTSSLRATNCISTMSFAKKALLYPRGDENGNPVTSGNIMTLTISNINDIEKNEAYGKAFNVVEVDNGKIKINYDGTNFDVLPTALNMRVLTIQNSLIPSNVIKDYCKNFFDYFKTARTLYTVPVLQTMFHAEPMDGVTSNFTTTKIINSSSNKPIYSAEYKTDGTMKVGVLI